MTIFPKNEKRVENTKRGGLLPTNFGMFGNVVKHDLSFLSYILSVEILL